MRHQKFKNRKKKEKRKKVNFIHHNVQNHFPRTCNSLSIMRSPLCRAGHLLKAFAECFYEEFDEEWKATRSFADTEPDPTTLSVFEEATKDCNAFLDFHKEHSTSIPASSSCQCELIEEGN